MMLAHMLEEEAAASEEEACDAGDFEATRDGGGSQGEATGGVGLSDLVAGFGGEGGFPDEGELVGCGCLPEEVVV